MTPSRGARILTCTLTEPRTQTTVYVRVMTPSGGARIFTCTLTEPRIQTRVYVRAMTPIRGDGNTYLYLD